MEYQEDRRKRAEEKKTGLVYIIVLVFLALIVTAYFLYDNLQRVQELETHKKVLMDRLGEELILKEEIEQKRDSILDFWNSYEPK